MIGKQQEFYACDRGNDMVVASNLKFVKKNGLIAPEANADFKIGECTYYVERIMIDWNTKEN